MQKTRIEGNPPSKVIPTSSEFSEEEGSNDEGGIEERLGWPPQDAHCAQVRQDSAEKTRGANRATREHRHKD
jgi:hypothetical protein